MEPERCPDNSEYSYCSAVRCYGLRFARMAPRFHSSGPADTTVRGAPWVVARRGELGGGEGTDYWFFFKQCWKKIFMWSFGLDFIVLTEGSVLRDLGVNSVIIMRVLGGGARMGPDSHSRRGPDLWMFVACIYIILSYFYWFWFRVATHWSVFTCSLIYLLTYKRSAILFAVYLFVFPTNKLRPMFSWTPQLYRVTYLLFY